MTNHILIVFGTIFGGSAIILGFIGLLCFLEGLSDPDRVTKRQRRLEHIAELERELGIGR